MCETKCEATNSYNYQLPISIFHIFTFLVNEVEEKKESVKGPLADRAERMKKGCAPERTHAGLSPVVTARQGAIYLAAIAAPKLLVWFEGYG